jgi:hypothetical protein
MIEGMKSIMNLNQITTLETVRQFPAGIQAVVLCVANRKQERYQWIQNFSGFSLPHATG